MNGAIFHQLLTAHGQAALAAATALNPSEATFLTCWKQLRKHYPDELANAAVETAILRIKARTKFSCADRMYFTREALEQASSEVVAQHRARRLAPYCLVADLCCGIGSDALAFAAAGAMVTAIDSDPLRVAMTEANAAALGYHERVHGVVGDARTVALPEVQAAFADPARRTDRRRFLDPEDYLPPLSAIRARFAPDFPLAVKIAPGVDWSDLPHRDAEVEFVSWGGELKECVLWFGAARQVARRATLLPCGAQLTANEPCQPRPVAPIGAVLYDPDPALTRAGLVHQLAEQLEAFPIDSCGPLLSARQRQPTPWASAYGVEQVIPFHRRHLGEYLRSQQVGRITVIKRGSLADADALVRCLRLQGSEHRWVFLTYANHQHVMIVCTHLNCH
ncbi:MAG: hypothetical protein RMJ56_10655 [Gemmataceae bacterium]|nr:hypothetical protein [Gemmata sp.]MDW8198050.1 hypothetical protein [Gemmataceae bacterium]